MEDSFYESPSLEEVRDIRKLMERSSRFLSLSGLSGIAAGICALGGAWVATLLLARFKHRSQAGASTTGEFDRLVWQLLLLALVVFVLALLFAVLFTRRRARKQKLSFWDPAAKRMAWNLAIPLVAGGLFIAGMLQYGEWRFAVPACLVFYGLSLVNAGKYTYSDIRWLGYCEIMTGLIALFFPGYGLLFWGLGFGLLHIIYGALMWWKYERTQGH